ncbi:MAG: uroporphyrinogen decarboxylase family protein [Bdellovibrionia bacterium]
MNLFQAAIRRQNEGRPPVWFMRQAGRYHSHYQNLKKTHSFMDLCKKPELACETTMGPIRDFNFDAAILFSDLLFPLEVMGMGLDYVPGPKLEWHLKSPEDLKRMDSSGATLAQKLQFQGDAMKLIRKELDPSKGLLGFVGGPLTLFCYAVDGSHQGGLRDSRDGLNDGRYEGFCERLFDLLAENMALQARGGCDTVAVLDTCAGEFDAGVFKNKVVPALQKLFDRFQKLCPNVPIAYYSKGTGPEHWKSLVDLPIAYLGIDWNHDISKVLTDWGSRWAIQGNIDPDWMLLDGRELEPKLREVFSRVKALPASARRGWVCGLGHGILQKTPESNVRMFLKIQREMFGQ